MELVVADLSFSRERPGLSHPPHSIVGDRVLIECVYIQALVFGGIILHFTFHDSRLYFWLERYCVHSILELQCGQLCCYSFRFIDARFCGVDPLVMLHATFNGRSD